MSDASPARVGLLLNAFALGGAEQLVVSLLQEWSATAAVEPSVFAIQGGGPLEAAVLKTGAPVHVIAPAGRYDPSQLHRLIRGLRRERVELLHAHLPRSGIVGALAARYVRIPSIYTEHSLWTTYHPVTRQVHRRCVPLHAAVVAVSEAVRSNLAERLPVVGNRTVVIQNGVPVAQLREVSQQRDTSRRSLGLGAETRLILNVGNLRAKKNQADLIKAFARLRVQRGTTTRLLIVGRDDGTEPDLRALIRALDVSDAVTLAGPRIDVPQLIAACDVFAISSTVEGLPMALLEACAQGRPCVATAVGGIPDVVDASTGWLVPPANVDALAAALSEALEDHDEAARRGAAAQALVAKHFSLSKTAAMYARIYARVLTGQSPDSPNMNERAA